MLPLNYLCSLLLFVILLALCCFVAMDTQDLDGGSVDLVEESTACLESTILAPSVTEDRNNKESHEPCGTRFLFTQYRALDDDDTDALTTTTVPKLRLGIAAACQSCRIVLDALTSYSNEWIPIDSIVNIEVASADWVIRVRYRPVPNAGEKSGQSRVRKVKLDLFCLQGM